MIKCSELWNDDWMTKITSRSRIQVSKQGFQAIEIDEDMIDMVYKDIVERWARKSFQRTKVGLICINDFDYDLDMYFEDG